MACLLLHPDSESWEASEVIGTHERVVETDVIEAAATSAGEPAG